MAAIAGNLTLAEFHQQFAGRKPNHEFWFGQAVSKAMPTWLHGLLQKIVMRLLDGAGYSSASEVKLKISPDFEPVPDVIATSRPIETVYPTQPVDVVVEILSPEDSFQRVIQKCGIYAQWGIANVFVLDPVARTGWVWENRELALKKTLVLRLSNGRDITTSQLFQELDAALGRP